MITVEKNSAPILIAETETWRVFSKPAGWHTSKGRDLEYCSCEDWLAKEFSELSTLSESGLVHRLDQWTTGCLLVAKTAEAQIDLRLRFRSGDKIRKWYWALVESHATPASAGEFSLYFSSRYRGSKKISIFKEGDAKDLGQCRWKLLQSSENIHKLEVELIGPGKRHQIRAGFSSIGLPLLGDTLYGGSAAPSLAYALHAEGIEIDGKIIRAKAPAVFENLKF